MLKNIYLALSWVITLVALVLLDGWFKLLVLPLHLLLPPLFVVLHFVFLFIVSLFIDTKNPPEKQNPFIWFIVTQTVDVLEMFFRIKLHVKGAELVPTDKRFLLVSNHRSMLDAVLTVGVFRHLRLVFICKPEVMKLPCIGPLVHACNFTAIDRENPRNAINCINYNAELLKNDTCSVGVYPEGTRSKDGKLLPFHDGVLKIAQKAGVPVVVATIEGTELIKKHCPWRRTDVYLKIHKVLENAPEARLRSHQLAAEARTIIAGALGEESD